MSSQSVAKRWFSKEWLLEQKSLIALLVLIAVVSSMSPNFFTVNNLFNILQQTSVNAIMAVGMTLVILTSGIDLSVGSLLALTGAVAASIVGFEINAVVAVAIKNKNLRNEYSKRRALTTTGTLSDSNTG